jgi:quercetin dioxygenase-like cupin family protein
MKNLIFVFAVFFAACFQVNAQYQKDIKVETLLKTDTTVLGQKISYPIFLNDEVTISKVIIPPGKSTGWHKHTIPVFAYVLKGNLTVELENGKVNEFSENSTISEVFDTYHNGMNKGKSDVVLIAFYLGEKGKPVSIKK